MSSSVPISDSQGLLMNMLAISVGSNELKAIGVAMVLWVLSDLLVEGGRLHDENKLFV